LQTRQAISIRQSIKKRQKHFNVTLSVTPPCVRLCVFDQDEFFALMPKAEKRVLFHQHRRRSSFLFVFCVSLEEFAGGGAAARREFVAMYFF
jgi:hypothetical protein